MVFVLDNEDDYDVVVDIYIGVRVGFGSVDDVDSDCLFWAMVRWHLLPSYLFHRCNIFCGRDCCCCCCCCFCCVVVVVVVVVGFVVVHDRCHSFA